MKNLFKTKEIKFKEFIIVSIILLLFSGLLVGVIAYNERKVDTIIKSEYNVTSKDMVYQIETMDVNDSSLIVSGYAAKMNYSIEYASLYVVLENEENEMIKINTEFGLRPDVTTLINDGNNYDHSGFYAKISKAKLSSGKYKVWILYQSNDNNDLVDTGEFINI